MKVIYNHNIVAFNYPFAHWTENRKLLKKTLQVKADNFMSLKCNCMEVQRKANGVNLWPEPKADKWTMFFYLLHHQAAGWDNLKHCGTNCGKHSDVDLITAQ